MVGKSTLALSFTAIQLMSTVAQAQYIVAPPRPEIQYYSPYSYQLQMDQYNQSLNYNKFQRQEQQLRQLQQQQHDLEMQMQQDWGCTPYTVTDGEACD